jgi:hypothetical protein
MYYASAQSDTGHVLLIGDCCDDHSVTDGADNYWNIKYSFHGSEQEAMHDVPTQVATTF